MNLKSAVLRVTTGLLVIYAMYYAGFGWLPISFTEDRILKYIINTEPLLGYLPIDFVLITLSIAAVTHLLKISIKPIIPPLAMTFTGYLLYAAVGDPRVLVLSSASAIITLYVLYKNLGLREVIMSAVHAIIILEVAAITSTLTYFAVGSWSLLTKAIVLRERFTWGFLEWASIPLLATSALLWTYSYVRKTEYPLKDIAVRLEKELAGVGIKYIVGPKALAVAVALALLAVALPHLPTVNPGLYPVSVDTYYYMKFISYADIHGLPQALIKFKGFARPAYLTILYYASRAVDPVILLDIVHPAIALTLLTIATYLFVRKFADAEAASIATLLTPLGHSTVTFIAGGFQANSIALPIALLMLATDPKSKTKLFALAVPLALIHPWTFIMYSAAYAAYAWRVKGLKIKGLTTPAATLLAALGISEIVDLLTAGVSPTSAAAGTVTRSIGLYLPQNLFRGVEFWTWGSQANALVFTTAALTYSLTPVTAVLAVTAPLLLITSSVIIHRLVLNTPLEAHASVLLKGLDRMIIIAVILVNAVRGLEVLSGMTPLVGDVWQAIIYRP